MDSTTNRAPFEPGNDLTIRQLLERIELASRRVAPTSAGTTVRINDLARRAIVIMDRLTGRENEWAAKYAEAKDLGMSDGEAESAADREVGRQDG